MSDHQMWDELGRLAGFSIFAAVLLFLCLHWMWKVSDIMTRPIEDSHILNQVPLQVGCCFVTLIVVGSAGLAWLMFLLKFSGWGPSS